MVICQNGDMIDIWDGDHVKGTHYIVDKMYHVPLLPLAHVRLPHICSHMPPYRSVTSPMAPHCRRGVTRSETLSLKTSFLTGGTLVGETSSRMALGLEMGEWENLEGYQMCQILLWRSHRSRKREKVGYIDLQDGLSII